MSTPISRRLRGKTAVAAERNERNEKKRRRGTLPRRRRLLRSRATDKNGPSTRHKTGGPKPFDGSHVKKTVRVVHCSTSDCFRNGDAARPSFVPLFRNNSRKTTFIVRHDRSSAVNEWFFLFILIASELVFTLFTTTRLTGYTRFNAPEGKVLQ